MNAQGTQSTGFGVNGARYDIGGEDVCAMRIGVTEEVGKGNGGERVVV